MVSKINPRKRLDKKKIAALTDRQRVFVHEYMADDKFNAVKAAEAAGYKNPYHASYRLLATPSVAEYLGLMLQKRCDASDVKAERVLRELAYIGFSDPRKMFNNDGSLLSVQELPEAMARSISSFEVDTSEGKDGSMYTKVKVRLWPKVEALTLLMKHLGMLLDKAKIDVDHKIDSNLLSTLLARVEGERKVIDGTFIEHSVGEASVDPV